MTRWVPILFVACVASVAQARENVPGMTCARFMKLSPGERFSYVEGMYEGTMVTALELLLTSAQMNESDPAKEFVRQLATKYTETAESGDRTTRKELVKRIELRCSRDSESETALFAAWRDANREARAIEDPRK